MRTALIILIVLIVGSGIFLAWQLLSGQKASQTNQTTTTGPTTLTFWGVYDDPTIFQPIIAAYEAQHPNVKVRYVRQDASLYEFVSLNLLASQEGPDIWMIPSEWLPKHKNKLSPMPNGFLASQNLPAPAKGLFAKKSPTPSNSQLYKELFAPVTVETNVTDQSVAAVPLSVDTLGLYGNTQLLSAAGITTLPRTWEEVVAAATKLANRTTLSFSQPAINLGTANNVSRATEILMTLMMQNHTPMLDENKTSALFNQSVMKSTGEPIQPGPVALDFYTSFASPTKENYSWNATQPQDFELFSTGKLPLFIDYSYRLRDIKQTNPNLPLTTGPLPQISLTDQPLTFSTSMMIGVPSVSGQQNQAWDFIKFLTSKENSLAYARAANRPPARIDLASQPPSNPALAPFIAQIGFATTLYRNEVNKTDTVFRQAIEAVLAGQPVTDVIAMLTKQVTHILRNESYE